MPPRTAPPRKVPSLRRVLLAILTGAILGTVIAWAMHTHWPGIPRVAARALESADQFELLSLYPYWSEPEFHNHRILGRTTITDPATRRRLIDALKTGADESDGTMKCCFNPRHGIRVTRDGQVTDFAICFECKQVRVDRDGKRLAFFLTSPSPECVFDHVLQSAGVPLAEKSKPAPPTTTPGPERSEGPDSPPTTADPQQDCDRCRP